MIRKVIDKFRSTKVDIKPLMEQIAQIRKEHAVLNLCAAPTGSSWLGVYNAGLSLFPTNTVALPQYYSNQLLSDEQCEALGDYIGSLQFDQLVFNGYNTYFSLIIRKAKAVHSKLRVGVIYHGFFGELSGNTVLNKITNAMIQLAKDGEIDKLGFLKRGNAEIFERLFQTPSFLLFNRNPKLISNVIPNNVIGVLTNESFRKNGATQVIAALSLQSYDVSLFRTDDYDMYDAHQHLVKLDHMDHATFLKTLSSNLINSHVTFSEASGGQVFTESLALGVPCLTSLTHGYLDDSEVLRKALVVDRFDDAWAIAQKMEEVIANRDFLSKEGLDYSEQMNAKATELLKEFLNY